MSHQHQDWHRIVITKKRKTEGPGNTGARTHTPGMGNRFATDVDDMEFSGTRVKLTHVFKVALMQARQDKKWTQAQLAQRMNVTPALIASYERGTVFPSGPFISKLNRILGRKLPHIPVPMTRNKLSKE